jgi:hypothetical protein
MMSGEMIKQLIDICTLIIIIVMIVSPAYFFAQVEKYLFNEDPEAVKITKIPEKISTMHHDLFEEDMLEDTRRLQAFDTVCKRTANNPHINRIWELKRAEYIRELKWKTLSQFAGGSERKGD